MMQTTHIIIWGLYKGCPHEWYGNVSLTRDKKHLQMFCMFNGLTAGGITHRSSFMEENETKQTLFGFVFFYMQNTDPAKSGARLY